MGQYSCGGEQHIHSISMLNDYENFLVADQKRINLFNLDYFVEPFKDEH